MKINVLHLCAWRMAIFKLDVVADWGISLLRTQLISYCWYYELQIKKFTYEISTYKAVQNKKRLSKKSTFCDDMLFTHRFQRNITS